MALRTNYKDDIFNGNRKYSEIDNGDGTISFTDETEYDQVGDTFGAAQINEIDTKINSHDTSISSINSSINSINSSISTANSSINALNNELTVSGTKFYFDYKNGNFGFNTSANRGADTFRPFSSKGFVTNMTIDALHHCDGSDSGWATAIQTFGPMTGSGYFILISLFTSNYRGQTGSGKGDCRITNTSTGQSVSAAKSGSGTTTYNYYLPYSNGQYIQVYICAEAPNWHSYAKMTYTIT